MKTLRRPAIRPDHAGSLQHCPDPVADGEVGWLPAPQNAHPLWFLYLCKLFATPNKVQGEAIWRHIPPNPPPFSEPSGLGFWLFGPRLASPGVSPRRKGPNPKLATTPLLRGYTWNFVSAVGLKTRMMAIPDRQKVCIYLDTLTALFGQTDGIAKIISRSACIVC